MRAPQRFLLLKSLVPLTGFAGALFSPIALHAESFTFTAFAAPGAVFGTFATGINNKGYVVGYYSDSNGDGQSFLRDPSGTLSSIDVPGAIYTLAEGINDAGVISGTYSTGLGTTSGFIRTSTGNFISFNLPGESRPETEGFGINNNNEVVTYSQSSGVAAVRSSDGSVFSDTTIPGANFTSARGINDSGQTVGGAVGGVFSVTVPYLMQPDHLTYSLLSVPRVTGDAVAFDINNVGDIVGLGEDSTGQFGFLRHNDGSYDIIQVPGGRSTNIYGINDSGEIVGSFRDPNGTYAFIGTPVPEPSSITLLLIGIGLIALTSRRRFLGHTRGNPQEDRIR